jgi:hypothetical protein
VDKSSSPNALSQLSAYVETADPATVPVTLLSYLYPISSLLPEPCTHTSFQTFGRVFGVDSHRLDTNPDEISAPRTELLSRE